MRFAPKLHNGKWCIADLSTPQQYLLPAVGYDARDTAVAYADVLNATAEGKTVRYVEDLRGDLDRERSGR
jgi:hypothetical protein